MLSVSRALPVLLVLAALLWQLLIGVSRVTPALLAERARADAAAALTAAQAAVAEARALGNLWSATEPLLARAERALGRGESARAARLAQRASRQASLALDQLRLERARYWLSRHGARLSAATHDAVAARIRARDGAAALALLPPEAQP